MLAMPLSESTLRENGGPRHSSRGTRFFNRSNLMCQTSRPTAYHTTHSTTEHRVGWGSASKQKRGGKGENKRSGVICYIVTIILIQPQWAVGAEVEKSAVVQKERLVPTSNHKRKDISGLFYSILLQTQKLQELFMENHIFFKYIF